MLPLCGAQWVTLGLSSWNTSCLRQRYTVNYLITNSPGEKKTLIYAICQFPWYKYFYQRDVMENGVGKVYNLIVPMSWLGQNMYLSVFLQASFHQ